MICIDIADWYEMYHISSWRQKAIDEMYEHICADDEFTDGISIGPVGDQILISIITVPCDSSFYHSVLCKLLLSTRWFLQLDCNKSVYGTDGRAAMLAFKVIRKCD